MKDKKVLVLNSVNDAYEALYVDEKCVDEGENLECGDERLTYFIKMSDEYDFDLREVEFKYLTEEDDKEIEETGYFPYNINGLKGEY